MTRRTLTATLAAAALLVASCGSNEADTDAHQPTTPTTSTTPSQTIEPDDTMPTQPDKNDGPGVAAYLAETLFAWRPTTDQSPADAMSRQRAFLADKWVADTQDTWIGFTSLTSTTWDEWAAKGATHTTATLTPNDIARPPDSPKDTYRAFTVKLEINDAAGTRIDSRTIDAFLYLEKQDGWKLADLGVQETPQ